MSFKSVQVLPALLLLLFVLSPGMVWAQSAPANVPDCTPGSQDRQNMSNNATAAAQRKVAAIHNFYSGIPRLDLKVNYCIDKIESLFDLAIGIGDPTHILGNIAVNILVSLANQVCQAAIQAVTSVINFGLSQFNRLCVPIPDLNLNLNGNLNLKGPSCNGVNLLGVKTTQGGAALPPSVWQVWQSPQHSGP